MEKYSYVHVDDKTDMSREAVQLGMDLWVEPPTIEVSRWRLFTEIAYGKFSIISTALIVSAHVPLMDIVAVTT